MKKYVFSILILTTNLFWGQQKQKVNATEVKEVFVSDSLLLKRGNRNTLNAIINNKSNLKTTTQSFQEVTDTGNTTNNSVIINKGTGTFSGYETAFFVGQNESIVGNSVANYTVNNRFTSNELDWTFSKVNESDFSGSGDISGVVGAYQIAKNSGSGNAISVYANNLKAAHLGTGNTDFLIGSTIKVNAFGSGIINYARSTSSTLTVDSPDITVNYAQAMHPTLKLQNGTVANLANIMYLDYDIGSLVNIQGDLSYIEAGEDGLTNFITGGEKRFIHYRGKLKSDFNGIINVQNPLSDIENATEKVLVTKEYVKNELNIDKNKSPWNNTDGTASSQESTNINYLNGDVGIGTTNTKGFKLGVDGQIVATEIKVATYANWADFVFDKKYKLPTLQEVEKHIIKKGHLKNIPNAEEVKKNGFYLADMNAKLLQKIEELTLYLITQDKRIKVLENKLKEIKK
jgi:hypothetical protein